MQVQIEGGTKNSGIKINNVLMPYFLQLEVNAKKIHGEENARILNKSRSQVCTFTTLPHSPRPITLAPAPNKIYL